MSSPAPAAGDSIQVFDKYGREFQVSREQWRKEVLPAALKSNWDNADSLYGGILQALNDNFIEEAAAATERLRELEPGSARAISALAFVRLRQKQLDEAQALLEGYLAHHPPESTVLNNLAKVHAERHDDARVEDALWRSLQADPNNDNSLGWYEALHRERGGAEAAKEALRRVAGIPNAWRARVHLARHALDARDSQGATALYQEALDMVGAEVPAEVLMTITGDLGKRGFLKTLLELAVPRYEAQAHGVVVGNNIIKAYFDSGRMEEARALVESLFRMNRPDWKSTLTFWDGLLVQAESRRTVQVGPTVEMAMYVIEGPVWAHAGSPVAKIFPPPAENAPRVAFIGGTAETGAPSAAPQVTLADAAGRLSRVLPLYLAEQAQLRSGARSRSLFAWMDNAIGGSFVVTTAITPDKDAIARAKAGGLVDLVVVTHVKQQGDQTLAVIRVLRASDGRCLHENNHWAPTERPDVIAAQMAVELQRALEVHAGTQTQPQGLYLPPAPPHLASYLLRLEQLLALRCVRSASALHGVREMIEGNLHLCLDFPQSVTMRALLADVVARMRNIRPDVVEEFRERLALLQQEHPVAEPAQSTFAAML